MGAKTAKVLALSVRSSVPSCTGKTDESYIILIAELVNCEFKHIYLINFYTNVVLVFLYRIVHTTQKNL